MRANVVRRALGRGHPNCRDYGRPLHRNWRGRLSDGYLRSELHVAYPRSDHRRHECSKNQGKHNFERSFHVAIDDGIGATFRHRCYSAIEDGTLTGCGSDQTCRPASASPQVVVANPVLVSTYAASKRRLKFTITGRLNAAARKRRRSAVQFWLEARQVGAISVGPVAHTGFGIVSALICRGLRPMAIADLPRRPKLEEVIRVPVTDQSSLSDPKPQA